MAAHVKAIEDSKRGTVWLVGPIGANHQKSCKEPQRSWYNGLKTTRSTGAGITPEMWQFNGYILWAWMSNDWWLNPMVWFYPSQPSCFWLGSWEIMGMSVLKSGFPRQCIFAGKSMKNQWKINWIFGALICEIRTDTRSFCSHNLFFRRKNSDDPKVIQKREDTGSWQALQKSESKAAPRTSPQRTAAPLGLRRIYGSHLLNTGRPEEAAVVLRQVVKEDPHSPGALNNLAVAEYRQGRMHAAIDPWSWKLEQKTESCFNQENRHLLYIAVPRMHYSMLPTSDPMMVRYSWCEIMKKHAFQSCHSQQKSQLVCRWSACQLGSFLLPGVALSVGNLPPQQGVANEMVGMGVLFKTG